MARSKTPSSPAVLALRRAGVSFTPRPYRYEPKGGTAASSRALGLDEHVVIKTLVMQDERAAPLVILMHGDLAVSTRMLARAIGVKKVTPCTPAVAQRHTGYPVGGTSPFGLAKPLPVYVEETILALETIAINGGGRGFLVELSPMVLTELLDATPVKVGIRK